MSTIMGSPYLLCSYKDGIQTYSNTYYNGNCDVYGMAMGADQSNIPFPSINISPNPFKDILQISTPSHSEAITLQIYTHQGQLVATKPHQSDQPLDLNTLPNGLYYLRIIEYNYTLPIYKI